MGKSNGNGHDKHPICERLRLIALGRQIGLSELSRRTGMSHGHLWTIMNGSIRSPWFSTVARILAALDADDIPIAEQRQRRAIAARHSSSVRYR